MPQPKRPRHRLAPWAVASIAVLFVLVVATAIATAQDDDAQCLKLEPPPTQEKPPTQGTPPPPLVFNGDVTVRGNAPSRQGYTITARIGDYWESTAVHVGIGSGCGSMRYADLFVAPPEELDLLGSRIQFWLNGQVRSGADDWYTAIDYRYPYEIPGADLSWTFPIPRQVDLEFPALPDDFRLNGTLPATGGTSSSKPMLAVFLILGLIATLSGLVAARRCYPKTTFSSP